MKPKPTKMKTAKPLSDTEFDQQLRTPEVSSRSPNCRRKFPRQVIQTVIRSSS